MSVGDFFVRDGGGLGDDYEHLLVIGRLGLGELLVALTILLDGGILWLGSDGSNQLLPGGADSRRIVPKDRSQFLA